MEIRPRRLGDLALLERLTIHVDGGHGRALWVIGVLDEFYVFLLCENVV